MSEQEKRNLQPSDFELVQKDSKIYDKKFETKPIGYFKDAMIRFGKNKTNVIASSILGFVILCSILVPILSTRNYKELESELAFLPPKMPFFGGGVLDGTSFKEGIPADVNRPYEDTGLLLPGSFSEEVIDLDTLENYEVGCTNKSEECLGGQNILRVDSTQTVASVTTGAFLTLTKTLNPEITIVIPEFANENGSTIRLLLKTSFIEPYKEVIVTEVAGTFTVNPFDIYPDAVGTILTQLRFEIQSPTNEDWVALESIVVTDDSGELMNLSGYELSLEKITVEDTSTAETEGGGLWVRQNGVMIMTNFRYFNYVAAFGSHTYFMPASEFDTIMAENPEVCLSSPHPNTDLYPDGEVFPEGCPIEEQRSATEAVTIDGVDYFSYNTVINYKNYAGYDEIPNFIFGTDINGRDLFTLLWVALRTSLLIGIVVAIINITVGVVYGAISGYYGGVVDLVLQRITEVIGRIPWLVTLSIFVSLFGPGIQTLILILIVSGWIGPQSVTRTQFYRYKGREYVLASRTLGAKDARLIFRHILPNGIGTIITSAVLMIPYAIFSESTISYLGFGVGHGQEFKVLGITFSGVSVGVLLSDGRNYLLDRPYLTVFPAILISILMITFNMFGNALRDAFNPALRGSE